MNGNTPHQQIALLVELLDRAFSKPSWHGPNLGSVIRGVEWKLATKRLPGRKTIWEQVLHAAYWKRIVLNKVAGTERFPRAGSNWPRMPERPDRLTWNADVELLREIHGQLLRAVKNMEPARLAEERLCRMIYGAAFHDIYHAGQIRLLRKMLK